MIIESGPLTNEFKCQNPFVYTMHHVDHFPAGDGKLEPVEKRRGGDDGDIDPKAPWRMYYGERVPGFPAHPHRGFETVTVVMEGTVDHTDGLGGSGRYEDGDVQWMTAGKGLQHAEMFPLRKTDGPNRMELFQIWLSLDGAKRMVEPAYKMLWKEEIPVIETKDARGGKTKVTLIAGRFADKSAPPPTSDSWAADPKNKLGIMLFELEPNATCKVPAGTETMKRSLYFHDGDRLEIGDTPLTEPSYAFVSADQPVELKNTGEKTARVLLLEAEPIETPIVVHGPFVMSNEDEIRQAYKDFRETAFGGWPFDDEEIYHAPDQVRYATYADGSTNYPPQR